MLRGRTTGFEGLAQRRLLGALTTVAVLAAALATPAHAAPRPAEPAPDATPPATPTPVPPATPPAEVSTPAEALADAPALTFAAALAAEATDPETAADQRAVRTHRRVAQALSGFTEHPEVVIYPGWRFAAGGGGRPEIQGQLTQGLSLGGLGEARQAALRAEGAALRAEVAAASLGRRLAVARAWIDARAAEEALAAAEDAVARTEVLQALVARAAAAGVFTADAVEELAVERAEVGWRRLDAEGRVDEAQLALGRLVPAASGLRWRTEGPLPAPALPPAAEWPAALARAEALPAVVAARLAARAAEARAAEQAAEGASRLAVGVQAQSDNGDFVMTGVLGFSLPTFDVQARSRAGARADQDRAAGRAAAAARGGASALATALHEVAHARALEATLQAEVLPAIERLVALRGRALAAGQGTAFDALRAESRRGQARAAQVRAAADRAWAEVQAWVLLDALAAADTDENRAGEAR